MNRKEFFIEIIKASPIGSIIETSEYINYETAAKLKLINFKKLQPKSVRLVFKKDFDSENKWIDFFRKEEISQLVIHYEIYHKDNLIAIGHDFPDFNSFNPEYYLDSLEGLTNEVDIKFSSELNKINFNTKRVIYFLDVSESDGLLSVGIRQKINGKHLDSRFKINEQDYQMFSTLFEEINEKDKLVFKGVYSSNSDLLEIGITIEKPDIWIDLKVESTKLLLSNLIWLQQVENKKEIEKLENENKKQMEETKKTKPTPLINTLLIGVMIGIIIFSVLKSSLGFFTLIPLYFIYKMVNNSMSNIKSERILKK